MHLLGRLIVLLGSGVRMVMAANVMHHIRVRDDVCMPVMMETQSFVLASACAVGLSLGRTVDQKGGSYPIIGA